MQGSITHTLPERIILRNKSIIKCILKYDTASQPPLLNQTWLAAGAQKAVTQ